MFGFLVGATGMFATLYSTQAILPQIGQTFHASASSAGLSVSVTIVMVAAGGWLWGAYSDRRGRKRSLVWASSLLVLPTAALAAVPALWVLLLFRALQGLCMPGLLTVAVPYVAEVFAPRLGGRAMGRYLVSLVVGGLVGRVGVAELSTLIGWRPALASLAVLPAIGAMLMIRTLPDAPPPRRSARQLRAVLAQLRNRSLRHAVAGGSALLFGFIGIFSYISFRLEASPFSLGTGTASLVFLLWAVGGVGPVAGALVDRFGWRKVALAGISFSGCGALVTLPDLLGTIGVGLSLVALGMFTGVTAVQIGVATSTESDRGSASGLYFTCYYLSGAVAAYLCGLAWEKLAWPGVVAISGGVLGCAALVLVVVLVRGGPQKPELRAPGGPTGTVGP